MIASIAGQAVITVVAAGIAIAVGYVSTRDIFVFQGHVDIGPARAVGNASIYLEHLDRRPAWVFA